MIYMSLQISINVNKCYFTRTENPCVGGSIPPLATNKNKLPRDTTLSNFLFYEIGATGMSPVSLNVIQ